MLSKCTRKKYRMNYVLVRVKRTHFSALSRSKWHHSYLTTNRHLPNSELLLLDMYFGKVERSDLTYAIFRKKQHFAHIIHFIKSIFIDLHTLLLRNIYLRQHTRLFKAFHAQITYSNFQIFHRIKTYSCFALQIQINLLASLSEAYIFISMRLFSDTNALYLKSSSNTFHTSCLIQRTIYSYLKSFCLWLWQWVHH